MAELAKAAKLSASPEIASLQLIKALGDLFYHGRSKRSVSGPRKSYKSYKKSYKKRYKKRYKKKWVPRAEYLRRLRNRR